MSPTFVLIFSVFVGSSLIFVAPIILVAAGSDFNKEVDMNWGGNRAQVLDGGKLASLTLDQTSGSGFQSKTEFLFGRVDMEIKLVPGNSAGTVTAFYLSSEWPNQDEIDFEFLGNLSGQPYIVHTNIYTEGKGNREQQFYLWFDPRKDFHTYSIVWNPRRIIFLVDSIPLRVFSSDELLGIRFPKTKPMRVYSSLWDAEQWATMGGRVKTDWSNAPFTAYFRNLKIEACTWSNGGYSACETKSASATARTTTWLSQELDATGRRRLRWVQKYFMVYNYCTDLKRFPQGHPRECKRSRF